IAFPMWPAGDVRKAGLSTFRVDVSDRYEPGSGTVKFFAGKKELYSAPFSPVKLEFEAPMPPAVVEALKTGAAIACGVYFASKTQKHAVKECTIVEKSGATKALARIDDDKKIRNDLIREFSKAEALQSNGLFSEALSKYVPIAKHDDRITIVYGPILECLR